MVGIFGIQLPGFLDQIERFMAFALGRGINQTQIHQRGDIVGIQFQNLAVIPDRSQVMPLAVMIVRFFQNLLHFFRSG